MNKRCLLGHDWVQSIAKLDNGDKRDVRVCLRCSKVETYSSYSFSFVTLEKYQELANKYRERIEAANIIIESQTKKP